MEGSLLKIEIQKLFCEKFPFIENEECFELEGDLLDLMNKVKFNKHFLKLAKSYIAFYFKRVSILISEKKVLDL